MLIDDIVGAGGKRGHAEPRLGAMRECQHGDVQPSGAHAGDDPAPVHIGQPQVEHDDVEFVVAQQVERVFAGVGGLDPDVVGGEQCGEVLGRREIVFNHKDAHSELPCNRSVYDVYV